ncbi:hypothetical protein, partial [Enterococcus sp. S183_ASV_20]|uniref:hypothetical protein n=1 Tax=Enterococcus sp. S183_ASV_20 TaxID=2847009 RepID=UPI001C100FF5
LRFIILARNQNQHKIHYWKTAEDTLKRELRKIKTYLMISYIISHLICILLSGFISVFSYFKIAKMLLNKHFSVTFYVIIHPL